MNISLIVAVDENWGIGYQGDLLVKIPEDLKYFKKVTTGHIVVMGRKTFESLPHQKPLPNRTNIVLTSDLRISLPAHQAPNTENPLIICQSIDEALKTISYQLSTINYKQDVFIIGGEQVYKAFLPYCTKAYITKIYHKFSADKFIPNFVCSPDWSLITESEIYTSIAGFQYQFLVYQKE